MVCHWHPAAGRHPGLAGAATIPPGVYDDGLGGGWKVIKTGGGVQPPLIGLSEHGAFQGFNPEGIVQANPR